MEVKRMALLILRWGRGSRTQKKRMTGDSCESDELNGRTNRRAYKRHAYARRAENKILTLHRHDLACQGLQPQIIRTSKLFEWHAAEATVLVLWAQDR